MVCEEFLTGVQIYCPTTLTTSMATAHKRYKMGTKRKKRYISKSRFPSPARLYSCVGFKHRRRGRKVEMYYVSPLAIATVEYKRKNVRKSYAVHTPSSRAPIYSDILEKLIELEARIRKIVSILLQFLHTRLFYKVNVWI